MATSATSFTRTYRTFATAVVDRYGQKKFEDQISRASPLMAFLMNDDGKAGRGAIAGRKSGGSSVYVPGTSGDYIKEPLMTDLNDTVKWYEGSETFSTNEQEVGTAAFFTPKSIGVTITITGKEQRAAKGEEAQISLIQALTDQAMLSIKNDLATALWGGQGSKAITGITEMVPSDQGTATAYGMITGTTTSNEWWRCQRSRTRAGTAGDMGDFTANFKEYGKRLFHDCSEGSEHPDIWLATQELEEAYDDLLLPYERHESKTARDLGYDNVLTFMRVPFLWDRKHPDSQLTTQRCFALNTNFIRIRYSPDANFKGLGFQRPANADAATNLVIWEGAMTTNCRRMHGVLTGITF